MDDDEDEKILEPTEPQTTSHIPQERIAARELRIQRRQNALKRTSGKGEGGPAEGPGEAGEEEMGPVERQAVASAALLEHLHADGEEAVSNVRVASDAREVQRRFAEANKNKEILTKLEEEAKLAEEKFQTISKNWNPILELNDPIEINEEIMQQKERCNDLIEQKNVLISNLKDEMKLVDETFYRDLQKQLKDIKDLSERIDAQVVLMRNAYESQLNLIESAIEMERALTIEYNRKRWEALYKKRDKEEMTNIHHKMEQIADFEKRMDTLTLEHREKYRGAKIQLEREIQTLQQELQQLKATCIINSEKIDYNFQVLKRREEENVFVRSQQKRKLNKMQDVINGLKKKIKDAQRDGAAEEAKATKEICRLHDVMLDLQVKAEHFASVNERKYQQLWRMNRETANELIEQIIDTDKIINEKILGIESPAVKFKMLKQSDLPSYKTAMEKIQKIDSYSCGSTSSDAASEITATSSENKTYNKSRNKLVGHILNLVADSSGFLIEERLWPLLQKYEDGSVLICKMDNVFTALEILHEEDVLMLCTYFSKYAYCPVCDDNGGKGKEKKNEIPALQEETVKEYSDTGSRQNSDSGSVSEEQQGDQTDQRTHRKSQGESSEEKMTEKSQGDQSADKLPRRKQESVPKATSEVELKITKSEQLLVKEVEQIFKDCSAKQDVGPGALAGIGDFSHLTASDTDLPRRMPVTCKFGHELKVSSVHVLNALQEFIASVVAADTAAKRPILSKLDTAISRSLKTEDVLMFWSKYKQVFSPQKEKLWDGLLFGLNKYLPVLQERQKLNDEVIQLRKQHSDLQHLLRGHIPAAEIPKTTFLSPISRHMKPPQ